MPLGGEEGAAAREFAFELRLPAAVASALALSAARAIHAALDRRAAARQLERRSPPLPDATGAAG